MIAISIITTEERHYLKMFQKTDSIERIISSLKIDFDMEYIQIDKVIVATMEEDDISPTYEDLYKKAILENVQEIINEKNNL